MLLIARKSPPIKQDMIDNKTLNKFQLQNLLRLLPAEVILCLKDARQECTFRILIDPESDMERLLIPSEPCVGHSWTRHAQLEVSTPYIP